MSTRHTYMMITFTLFELAGLSSLAGYELDTENSEL